MRYVQRGGTTDSTRNTGDDRKEPRAIIHKQILDYAESNPEASMEAIADAVSGGTTATVERVLEKYGDPIDEESDDELPTLADDPSTDEPRASTDGGATEAPDSVATDDPATADERDPTQPSAPVLDRSALTEKQRETLRAIYDHPDATQAELANRLGVSSPTISQRVNSIDDFDWSNRRALVDPLFESADGTERASDHARQADDAERADSSETDRQRAEPAASRSDRANQHGDQSSDGTDDEHRLAELVDLVDELAHQMATVEQELETLERRDSAHEAEPSVLAEPELAHKIVHACVHSDRITEDEELRLLRDVTTAGANAASSENGTDPA